MMCFSFLTIEREEVLCSAGLQSVFWASSELKFDSSRDNRIDWGLSSLTLKVELNLTTILSSSVTGSLEKYLVLEHQAKAGLRFTYLSSFKEARHANTNYIDGLQPSVSTRCSREALSANEFTRILSLKTI